MVRGAIIGPSLCGKTTLAQSLSRTYESKFKMQALVLDPWLHKNWGQHAIVTNDEEKFWKLAWASKRCLVVVDEAAATIRRDRSLAPVFTMLRHNEHKLLVMGHSGADFLPAMRQQFDTLYLFRTDRDAAEIWAKLFTDKRLYEAEHLQQYEFIRKLSFRDPEKMILQQPQAPKK